MTPGKEVKNPPPYDEEIMASFYNLMYKKPYISMKRLIDCMQMHVPKWRKCKWVDRKIKKMVQYYVNVKHHPIAKADRREGGYCWDERPETWAKEERYYKRSVESASTRKKAAGIIKDRFANNELKGLSK